jgi:hypothetical protein
LFFDFYGQDSGIMMLLLKIGLKAIVLAMNFYFDYVYYRISKLYLKYDKGRGVYGYLYILMTEGILLMDLLIFLERFFFTTQQIQGSKTIGPIIATISILPFGVFNYVKYILPKGKYEQFDNYWKNEPKAKRIIKGFLIFISLIIPWLLQFLINPLNQCTRCGF